MRVAVVCPYDLGRPGGVQIQAVELTRRLCGVGHDAWLVGPGETGPVGARLVGRAVGVRANRSVAPVALAPGVMGRVRAALQGADLVHVHEPFVPLVAPAAVTVGTDAAVVATFHADASPGVRRLYRIAGPLWKRLLRNTRVVTAVSEVAAEPPRSLTAAVRIVPNGVEVASYRLPVERRDRRVVFLGRDEPRKGLDVLLSAWSLVRREVPDAELEVLGAAREQVPAGVCFRGRLPDEEKRRALAGAGVFCAPNLGGESFGITVLEGMAAGCAVVASDLRGFRELLGGEGVLVPPGDPAALAAALVRVLQEDALRTELAGKGSKRAELFDWAGVLDRYLEVYAEACA